MNVYENTTRSRAAMGIPPLDQSQGDTEFRPEAQQEDSFKYMHLGQDLGVIFRSRSSCLWVTAVWMNRQGSVTECLRGRPWAASRPISAVIIYIYPCRLLDRLYPHAKLCTKITNCCEGRSDRGIEPQPPAPTRPVASGCMWVSYVYVLYGQYISNHNANSTCYVCSFYVYVQYV